MISEVLYHRITLDLGTFLLNVPPKGITKIASKLLLYIHMEAKCLNAAFWKQRLLPSLTELHTRLEEVRLMERDTASLQKKTYLKRVVHIGHLLDPPNFIIIPFLVKLRRIDKHTGRKHYQVKWNIQMYRVSNRNQYEKRPHIKDKHIFREETNRKKGGISKIKKQSPLWAWSGVS